MLRFTVALFSLVAILSSANAQPIAERLLPSPKDAGFRMEGYLVWGGSIIKVGNKYHLFASRWPEGTGDERSLLRGYREHSEIVRAVADDPIGPYEFQEVVLDGRGGDWWDGKMCHNPKIVRADDTFVLYYIGSAEGSPLRKVGYAWSKSITGPWQRIDKPLPLGEDHNNPAPFIHEDGQVMLAYRDRELHMHIASAAAWNGEYKLHRENIWPDAKLEDPDLAYRNHRYHMIVEDNVGGLTGRVRHGAHLVSQNGFHWSKHDPVETYGHTIEWTDGTSTHVDRRERPELFNANAARKGTGEPTHLVTGIQVGDHSWCHVQAIAPPEPWRSLLGSWHTTRATKSMVLSIRKDGRALMMFIQPGQHSMNHVPWEPFQGGILVQGIPRVRLWHGRHDQELRAEIEPISEIDYDPDEQFMQTFFMRRIGDRQVPKGWKERPVPESWKRETLDEAWNQAAGKPRKAASQD